jgi:hypothetical protein
MSKAQILDALIGAEKCITQAIPHLPPDTLAVFCGEWLADIRETIAHEDARIVSAAPELLDALLIALPFVEDHEDSNIYKAGAVARALATIRSAIQKATA